MTFNNKLLLFFCLAFGCLQGGITETASNDNHKGDVVLAAGEQRDDWVMFISKEHHFSVEFPKSPEHLNGKIDIPKTSFAIYYNTYVSEPSEDKVFVVSVWDYPPVIDFSRPDMNLQEGFEGMLQALPGAVVEKREMTKTQGYQTLEFAVHNDDVNFEGKLILVDHTLYQVFSIHRTSQKSEFDYFQRTFKVSELSDSSIKSLKKKSGKKAKI